MPVFSYIAYPKQGQRDELIIDLAALKYCEVIPSDNEEILILVTDAPNENKEKELQHMLKNLKPLQSLGLTFGHTEQYRSSHK
jgi:nitrate reductase NapAB chaperone NapD